LASLTSVLKATGGDGYAWSGYSAAIAAARAAVTLSTEAITRWQLSAVTGSGTGTKAPPPTSAP
jgi:hypothetical protein